MFAFAAWMVVTAVLALAIGSAVATVRHHDGIPMSLPVSLAAAVIFGGMLAIGGYAPTENPDALNEKAHALTISGMYLQAEHSASGAPWADPYRKGAISEDDACTRSEDWFGHAQDIDLR